MNESGSTSDAQAVSHVSTAEKSKVEMMKAALEVAAKLLFGLAGLCYVLGLVVMPLHLSPYGLNSFDLPQVSYAVAGMWAVLPIVLIVMSVIFATYLISTTWIDKQTILPGAKKWMDVLFTILVVPLLLFLVISFLINRIGIDFTFKNWIGFPLLGTVAALIILVGILRLVRTTRRDSLFEAIVTLGILVVGAILFLGYLILFSRNTYNTIPWAVGGGRPSIVRVLAAPESRQLFEAMKVPLSREPDNAIMTKTESIKLILATEKQLVVLNSDGNAVSLPAETVKAISYEK
jgi:hypothetical protein